MGTAGIAAGLACGVAAAGCYELGYVAQAGDTRAFRDAGGERAWLLPGLARRRPWLAGTALVACGLLLQLLGLRLAPLSVVQPALVLGLGLLVVLAERRLGERLGRRGRLAVAAAAVGLLLIALGGGGRETAADGHPVTVLAVFAVVVALALGIAHAGRRPLALVLAAGLGEAWAVIAAKVAMTDVAGGALASAAGWGVAAAVCALLALNAEMTGLQRIAATVAGPLVLVAQAGIPVLLAPSAVGEHWASVPAVLVGLAFVISAAVVLGSARVAQAATA